VLRPNNIAYFIRVTGSFDWEAFYKKSGAAENPKHKRLKFESQSKT
jgi:hypothetical protein